METHTASYTSSQTVSSPAHDVSTVAQTYRHRWMVEELQPRLTLRVVHRVLQQRMHAAPRRLPQYAIRELAEVRDRETLLSTLPSHVIPVWVEGELAEQEAVSMPLTGWGVVSDAPLTTLRFERCLADLDTPPLLASSENGTLQIATELQLLLDGCTVLRIWRFAPAAAYTITHGKRTIRMLSREERESLHGWHAISVDGAALLQLDVPTLGTDGLADIWHISAVQIAIPTAQLYRKLVRYHMLSPLRPRSPSNALCSVQLSFHSLDGGYLSRARFDAELSAQAAVPAAIEHRRVKLLLAALTPRNDSPIECDANGFLPKAGIVCIQVVQGRDVVLSASTHFSDSLQTPACWAVGEAEYVDTSEVVQRESMAGTISIGRVSVRATAPDDEANFHWSIDRVNIAFQAPWNADEQGVVFSPHTCEKKWADHLRHLAIPGRLQATAVH